MHAHLIWPGDILVLYATCGAIVFLLRRLDAVPLIGIGLLSLIVGSAIWQLFGWSVQEFGPEYQGYTLFSKDGHAVGGCMEAEPAAWGVYLASPDARATATAATAHGGGVAFEPMDVFDNGTMAVVSDPGGATIGVWQAGTEHGFGVLGEPDTPGWFELRYTTPGGSFSIYRVRIPAPPGG